MINIVSMLREWRMEVGYKKNSLSEAVSKVVENMKQKQELWKRLNSIDP